MVNSSSDCNVFGSVCDFFGEGLSRGIPSQGFAGAVVHEFGDVVEVSLGELSEVCALGQELAQEAVGVFVRPTLPGRMGVTEPDVDLQPTGSSGWQAISTPRS